MSKQSIRSLTVSLFILPAFLGAQGTTTPATPSAVPAPAAAKPTFGGPKPGDMAPDFTLPAVTRYGALGQPIKLSDLKGQTVVLAFFPAARTSGCTIQLEKYRDNYSTLAPSSKVTYIAISVDDDTTLANWSREAGFPFLLASDKDGTAGKLYGAYDTTYKREHRLLYVINRNGKIVSAQKPFNVSDKKAYDQLESVVRTYSPEAKTNISMVKYDSAKTDLVELLKSEAAKAKAMNKMPVVEFVANWCGPCHALSASMGDPRMEDAFKNVYLIRLDHDAWEEKWKAAELPNIGGIPAFFALDSNGKPTGARIDGGAWNEDIPANQAPPLKKFFDEQWALNK